MSKMNNANTNTQYKNNGSKAASSKYFCKVCQDAGKPESIYTSHNVRQTQDKTAPVTCPTLLAQECRYCHKQGHSIKYCAIIKEQNDRKQQYQQYQHKEAQQPIRKPEAKKNTSKNVYMIFADESDEEREREQERIRNPVPTPQIIQKTPANPSAISYASVLAKEKETEFKQTLPEVKQYVPMAYKPQAKFNWADCDSDDEEEYYASIKEEDE